MKHCKSSFIKIVVRFLSAIYIFQKPAYWIYSLVNQLLIHRPHLTKQLTKSMHSPYLSHFIQSYRRRMNTLPWRLSYSQFQMSQEICSCYFTAGWYEAICSCHTEEPTTKSAPSTHSVTLALLETFCSQTTERMGQCCELWHGKPRQCERWIWLCSIQDA